MVIHFDVENNDGDRTLYLEGTRVLVGWIEQGRKRGGKVEWAFTPNHPTAPRGKVTTRGISPAYEDARAFVAEYLTVTDGHGNRLAREGVDRCACGAKYWENDVYVSCGAAFTKSDD